MEQNLIKGGIYTTSEKEHSCYIFLKEGIINKVMFLEVRVPDLTHETVNRYFKLLLKDYDNEDLRNYLITVDKTLFLQKCNGFLGIMNLQSCGRFK